MTKQYKYNNKIYEIDDTKKLYKKNTYRDLKGYTLRYNDNGRMREYDIYDYHDVLEAFDCEFIEEAEMNYGTLANQICYDFDLTVNYLYTPSEIKLDCFDIVSDIYNQALDNMMHFMFYNARFTDEEKMQKCKKLAINKYNETIKLLDDIITQCKYRK